MSELDSRPGEGAEAVAAPEVSGFAEMAAGMPSYEEHMQKKSGRESGHDSLKSHEQEFKSIELREYEPGDDVAELAKLIYDTDPYIYPCLFGGDRERAKKVVAEMIKNPDTLYAAKNLSVAMNANNEMVGMIVAFDTPVKVDKQAMRDCFLAAGEEITPDVERTITDYYGAMEEESAGNIYIMNVCVDDRHRGEGIGGQMLDQFLKPDRSYHLDAIADNEPAVRLYKSKGFEVYNECDGFRGVEDTPPHVVQMERKAVSE